MKKQKGFVLVETIVTAVFVLGLFTFLIANILPLVGDYERGLEHDSIESKYDAHLIRKMILKDSNHCRIKNLLTLPDKNYYLFEKDRICGYLSNVNYCKLLLSEEYLDVKNIILTNYNVSELKPHASAFNRTLEEYIKHMPNYSNTVAGASSQYFYKRRLIIEFNDGRVTTVELLLDYEICTGGTTC